jgi:hypothetical protein
VRGSSRSRSTPSWELFDRSPIRMK